MSKVVYGAIGGYFELELPVKGQVPHAKSVRFQSARAAFLALLRARQPDKIWMPTYICDAMVSPLRNETMPCSWYNVDNNFAVHNAVQIGPNDVLLYVNYFGICDGHVEELLQRFSPQQIVLDFSQSFFSPPRNEALATIYSPRKFFGIPDGGILVSQMPMSQPMNRDDESFGRLAHLIRRLGDSPESGYDDFCRAEESLSNCEPKGMSELTERILRSIDFDLVRERRNENFAYLHRKLRDLNPLRIDFDDGFAPMCYPFVSTSASLKSNLIANRIFIPTYWPEALARVQGQFPRNYVECLVPLPVDQRYGTSDMDRIASFVRSHCE